MKYKDFYREKLSDEILEHIDDNHRLKMDSLIQRLNNDMSWTNNQKKRQISSILSNIIVTKQLLLRDTQLKDSLQLPGFGRSEYLRQVCFLCFRVFTYILLRLR